MSCLQPCDICDNDIILIVFVSSVFTILLNSTSQAMITHKFWIQLHCTLYVTYTLAVP